MSAVHLERVKTGHVGLELWVTDVPCTGDKGWRGLPCGEGLGGVPAPPCAIMLCGLQ